MAPPSAEADDRDAATGLLFRLFAKTGKAFGLPNTAIVSIMMRREIEREGVFNDVTAYGAGRSNHDASLMENGLLHGRALFE